MVSIIISLLALLATFYQLYLQRVHNEKSLKPLGQIFLVDRKDYVAVQILNNGLGPLIIDRILFKMGDNIYSSIQDCLDLDPKAYSHSSGDNSVEKVILPNSALTVFEAIFDETDSAAYIHSVRMQLKLITLKTEGRDIYEHKIILERELAWFARHASK
ncbi:hypothetical protein J2I46_11510 [Fibrella sp. HMF5405]|uniref:Uncharacterized protein n=1 Tax=Fibrella forsythiae TaxID=2817061 RepID=A0ABS3JGS4_9BACT|nr:hypothetical protein [Fibrella forsythiae]